MPGVNGFSVYAGTGIKTYNDGPALSAGFDSPTSLGFDAQGNLFVADNGIHRIRKITPAGMVSTFAGDGTQNFADGPGTNAKFNFPQYLAVDKAGYVYVSDRENNRIRKIAPNGEVSTLAGNGTAGIVDGLGTSAQINLPTVIAINKSGNLYVEDQVNSAIRAMLRPPVLLIS